MATEQKRELRKMADRIQGRAIKHCGDLLKEIEKSTGGRPPITRDAADPSSLTRTQAATDAGLSEHQHKTAIRVSNIPDEVPYAHEGQCRQLATKYNSLYPYARVREEQLRKVPFGYHGTHSRPRARGATKIE